MWNPTSSGQNTLVNTSATLTLGFGPGYTAPPQLLVQNLSAGGTVTLPKINQVGPTAPGTPGTTPGIGDGYLLILKSITWNTTTITPASGDTCDVAALTNSGDTCILQSDAGNSKWRSVSGQLVGGATQIATAAGNATIATTTRYQIVSAAATITIPATLNVGQPVTIMNESTGSLTVTPASGTIGTTASYTMSTLTSITFIGDGTNFHLINSK